jgi:hypothetical protein
MQSSTHPYRTEGRDIPKGMIHFHHNEPPLKGVERFERPREDGGKINRHVFPGKRVE